MRIFANVLRQHGLTVVEYRQRLQSTIDIRHNVVWSNIDATETAMVTRASMLFDNESRYAVDVSLPDSLA